MSTFYIESYGCTSNLADAERIISILINSGFKKTNFEEAEYVIVNTCGVKTPTENKILKRLKALSKTKKKVIVSGCLPSICLEKIKESIPNFKAIVDVRSLNKIPELINSKGRKIIFADKPLNKAKILPFPLNKVIGILPISEGCLGNCSYCCARLARKELYCYPIEDIVQSAKILLARGVKELWITAQDTASFNPSLPELINKLSSLDGNFKIRIGMMNPDSCLKILNPLIASFKNDKVFKFLHIPVQSGSNKVLKSMNRKYKISDFKKIVKAFRKSFPEISISTDIICGFTDESEEDFKKTLDLIKEIKPDVLNISRYWERPGTPKGFHGKITKQRSRVLSSLFKKLSFEKNKKSIGKKYEVIVDEKGKARNLNYKQIIVPADFELGKYYKVKIFKASETSLFARKI